MDILPSSLKIETFSGINLILYKTYAEVAHIIILLICLRHPSLLFPSLSNSCSSLTNLSSLPLTLQELTNVLASITS